jgi:hypothetical protein
VTGLAASRHMKCSRTRRGEGPSVNEGAGFPTDNLGPTSQSEQTAKCVSALSLRV